MLVSVLIAAVVSLLASSMVLLGQAFVARSEEQRLYRQQRVMELASTQASGVTVDEVAAALALDGRAADRLLRGMVDDINLTMVVDDKEGVLRFAIPTAPEVTSDERPRRRATRVR